MKKQLAYIRDKMIVLYLKIGSYLLKKNNRKYIFATLKGKELDMVYSATDEEILHISHGLSIQLYLNDPEESACFHATKLKDKVRLTIKGESNMIKAVFLNILSQPQFEAMFIDVMHEHMQLKKKEPQKIVINTSKEFTC